MSILSFSGVHCAFKPFTIFPSSSDNAAFSSSLDSPGCFVPKEEQPDFVLISGDVFHTERPVADKCCEEIVTATEYIRELAAVSEHVVVMRGTPNHDGLGQFHVLNEIFYSYPNVHIDRTTKCAQMPICRMQNFHFPNASFAIFIL